LSVQFFFFTNLTASVSCDDGARLDGETVGVANTVKDLVDIVGEVDGPGAAGDGAVGLRLVDDTLEGTAVLGRRAIAVDKDRVATVGTLVGVEDEGRLRGGKKKKIYLINAAHKIKLALTLSRVVFTPFDST